MEKCNGHCDHCGSCGKNRTENRIVMSLGEKEITNRDLLCRDCAYKIRGNTLSCYKYEKKPDSVITSGKCDLFLKESVMANQSSGQCGCDGKCGKCKNEG